MIKIFSATDNVLITTYEGWLTDAYEKAIHDIKDNGFDYVKDEIDDFGNMIIWVRCR